MENARDRARHDRQITWQKNEKGERANEEEQHARDGTASFRRDGVPVFDAG
jgi:hypothetical protein